jgi:hypothetical protein
LDDGGDANTPPLVFVPLREDRQPWDQLQTAISAKKEALASRKNDAKPEFELWLAAAKASPLPEPSSEKLAVHMPLNYGPAAEDQSRPGPFGPAPRLTDRGMVCGEKPVIDRHGQASYGAFVYVEDKPSGAIMSRMDKAEKYRGWDILLGGGKPTVHIIDQYPETALKITAKQALAPGQWHHVLAVFDGAKKGADALSLYVDGHLAEVEFNNNNLGSNIVANVPFRLGARSDKSEVAETVRDGKIFIQDARFYNRTLREDEVARLAAGGLLRAFFSSPDAEKNPESTNIINNLFLACFDAPSRKLNSEMAALKSEESKLRERGGTTLVMQEKKDTAPVAYLLARGNYAAKGDKLEAATPAAFAPMAPNEPRNRLGLARWIVSRENPLAARVTVNRLWANIFGTGIVETTEDFGVMGARPTNQPLLDWLAVEFMDSGWDFRRMVRLMVTSAAYRQSGAVSREKLEKDPQNKLVSRGPRFRLDAEEIRDQALAASGLLVPRVGGPPARPYQPQGVWEAVAMTVSNTREYKQDQGDALYRRSLYTFWKRIAPPPSMEILNAPSRETFCTRRDRTDTPLQAFVTMNDPQFVEAARRLAARAVKSSGGFNARLDFITDSLITRPLTGPERAVIGSVEKRAQENYGKNPDAAKELIHVGDSKPDESIQPSELAAWTVVASEIMNLDESLSK